MSVDFSIIDHAGDGVARCSIGDIGSAYPSNGTVPVPHTGTFRIIRITDVTMEQVTKFCVAHMDTTDPLNPIPIYKRLYTLDPAKMTTPQRNAWNTNRYIEATYNTARKWIKNKATGNYEG